MARKKLPVPFGAEHHSKELEALLGRLWHDCIVLGLDGSIALRRAAAVTRVLCTEAVLNVVRIQRVDAQLVCSAKANEGKR